MSRRLRRPPEQPPLAAEVPCGDATLRQEAYAGQVVSTLLRDGEAARTVISSARELEHGARGMLLIAPGLFRLDVRPLGDTLGIMARNLSDCRMRFEQDSGYGTAIATRTPDGDLFTELPGPSRFGVKVVIDTGPEPAVADIVVCAQRDADRGVTTLSARATCR